MNKLIIGLISILCLASSFLIGQSEYFDHSYGNEGVTIMPFIHTPIYFYNFHLDDRGRVHLSLLSYNLDSDTIEADYILTRLDEDGNRDQNWGWVQQLDSLLLTEKIDVHLFEGDKILSEKRRLFNLDTVSSIKQYDSELNYEVTYSTPDRPTSYWTDYYGQHKLFDTSGKLVLVNNGSLERYKTNGYPDDNFNDSGTLKVFENDTILSNLTAFFTNIINNETDNSLLYSAWTVVSNPTTQEVYQRSSIAKVDRNGKLVKNFGDEGFFNLDTSKLSFKVFTDGNDDYYSYNYKAYELQDTCPNGVEIEYEIINLDENGVLDQSYGESGVAKLSEGCNDPYPYNYPLLLPDGSFLLSYYDQNTGVDTTSNSIRYNFHFQKLNADGKWDRTFGIDGKLDLPFFDYTFMQTLELDQENNLYIAGYRYTDEGDSEYYVTKLRGEKLWPELVPAGGFEYSLTLLPNPSIGETYVNYEGLALENVTVRIHDMQGRLVSRKIINRLSNGDVVSITDSDLSTGTYLVNIFDENKNIGHRDKLIIVE